ncbi:hypothetical protein N752_23245 [Desulforamulus aquiferis]|nr:hypothetical protein N752_23245 [Desulforamulus aquiferis]
MAYWQQQANKAGALLRDNIYRGTFLGWFDKGG